MMYKKLKSHNYALYVLCLIVLIALLLVTTLRRRERACLALQAKVVPATLRFVSEPQLIERIDLHARRPLIGHPTHHLNLDAIEQQLASYPYIRSIEVYRLHNGDIATDVWQKEPLVRLSPPELPDRYLTKRGELLALSDRFTARVPVLYLSASHSPIKAANWHKPTDPQYGLFRFLHRIADDAFWRAQIATLSMNAKHELLLYPQLSDQVVYFGAPRAIDEKLEKLELFYTHILPQKGWNSYQRVDLRFRNQIICR